VQPADVLLLHHAQGLTEGVRAFANTLREAGHSVHAPDLYEGKTFPTLDDGLAYARQIGVDQVTERGVRSADGLPADLIYIGFSLGVLAAQDLAQTRPGARGAVLLEACAPPSEFGTVWPAGVPVQIHGMSGDPFFAGEGDLVAAKELVEQAHDGELFVYPGDRHLFTDSSLPTYDAAAASLVSKRVLTFLASH
jgi:dienelactone hydrolase